MPTISVKRDSLFKALGQTYSKFYNLSLYQYGYLKVIIYVINNHYLFHFLFQLMRNLNSYALNLDWN